MHKLKFMLNHYKKCLVLLVFPFWGYLKHQVINSTRLSRYCLRGRPTGTMLILFSHPSNQTTPTLSVKLFPKISLVLAPGQKYGAYSENQTH